jgi:tetratricopeptide (TPR) repeat protein
MPDDITRSAVEKLEDINFRFLTATTIELIVRCAILIAIVFVQFKLMFYPAGLILSVFLLIPDLLLGLSVICAIGTLIYAWGWQPRVEAVLSGEQPAAEFTVELSERVKYARKKLVAEYRQSQFPQRRYSDVELFRETCNDISLGHDHVASVFFDKRWPGMPLAMKIGETIAIVRPSRFTIISDFNKSITATTRNWLSVVREQTEILKSNSEDVNALLTRAGAYEQLKLLDKAIADYTRVIAIKPKHEDAYRKRAHLYDEKGEYAKAHQDRETVTHMHDDW